MTERTLLEKMENMSFIIGIAMVVSSVPVAIASHTLFQVGVVPALVFILGVLLITVSFLSFEAQISDV